MGWRSRPVILFGRRWWKFLHLFLQGDLLLIWGLTVTAWTAWWWQIFRLWLHCLLYRLLWLGGKLRWTFTSWASRWFVNPSVTGTFGIIFWFCSLWLLWSFSEWDICSSLTVFVLTQTKVLIQVVIRRFDLLLWWVLLPFGTASGSFRICFGLFAATFVDFTFIILVDFGSFSSSSFSYVSTWAVHSNTFKDLVSICSIFIIWWVQPCIQGVSSLCLCSSSLVPKWWVRLQCGLPGSMTLSDTLGQATAHFLIFPWTILH